MRHEAGELRATPEPPVVGLDVARSLDRDESVAAVSQGSRLHSLTTWRVRDLVETSRRAIEVADEAERAWLATSYVPGEVRLARRVLLVVDAPGVGSA